MNDEQIQTTAAESLRRLAQAVATLDNATPRVDLGDSAVIREVELGLGITLPETLRQMYLDANPVALTLPLPTEDIEFCPIAELEDLRDELDLPLDVIAFAREDGLPIAVAVEVADPEIVVGSRTSTGWAWETVASGLRDFLAAMAEIAEAFASTGGDLATRFELEPSALVGLEERLSSIDDDYADRWMEWIG